MSDVNTVTIPLEEYIELRRKADENFYLVDRLGQPRRVYFCPMCGRKLSEQPKED